MKLGASISISRISSNVEPRETIAIRVTDRLSGCQMVEVLLTPEQFALALTGCGQLPCEADFNDSGKVGKKHEVKHVDVLVPKHNYADRYIVTRMACSAFETDGWKADDSYARNHHYRVRSDEGGTVYRVPFRRWVEVPPPSEAGT